VTVSSALFAIGIVPRLRAICSFSANASRANLSRFAPSMGARRIGIAGSADVEMAIEP
jgi:hypothetical protein